MSNPNALYLLADHIKLSLLERQRTKALDLLQSDDGAAAPSSSASGAASDAQDGHIARSLDQFRDGLDALKREQTRLEEEGNTGKAITLGDALPGLQRKLDELTAQFNGQAPVATATKTPKAAKTANPTAARSKAVRFQDKPLPPPGTDGDAADVEAQRSSLFRRYTDDPTGDEAGGNAASAASDDDDDAAARYADHDNRQLLQMHERIMADQDAQLDALGASIGRQRELSMQIGDELDNHVALLEAGERVVDRHQTRIDRARRQVGNLARSASDCKQMVAIVVLIIILVLLIAILK